MTVDAKLSLSSIKLPSCTYPIDIMFKPKKKKTKIMVYLFLVYHFPWEHLKKISASHNLATLSCTRDFPHTIQKIEVDESEAIFFSKHMPPKST